MLRFKILFKVKTVLEHVANSNKSTYLDTKPVCSFMSEFITLADCCIKYRKRNKYKTFHNFLNVYCHEDFFLIVKLTNIKHLFSLLRYDQFYKSLT